MGEPIAWLGVVVGGAVVMAMLGGLVVVMLREMGWRATAGVWTVAVAFTASMAACGYGMEALTSG